MVVLVGSRVDVEGEGELAIPFEAGAFVVAFQSFGAVAGAVL